MTAGDLAGQVEAASAGRARLCSLAPNPAGGVDALWAIDGDFTSAPALADPAALPDRASPGARRLRIFHVNDMHNHLFDTAPDGTVTHRLAEMAARVARARAQAGPEEAVLFLSAGDDHTGTLLDELVGWSAQEFELDPSYRALSAAGLDAGAIGNHEFDRGAAQLALGARDARFPLLSANVHSSAHLAAGEHYHAALLADVNGLRVGLVALTTRVETRVGQPSDPGMQVASPVETLGNLLPLVDRLADVVVILSHCGYGDGSHVSGKASAPRDIGEADFALADLAARLATRPTVIVGAHTHTRLNEHGLEPENLRSGIAITQAEANGRYLGEILIDTAGQVEARLHAIGAPGAEVDAGFAEAQIAPLVGLVAGRMEEVIGEACGAGAGWAVVRDSRYSAECALANFMNDAMVAQLGTLLGRPPDLALLNGGSILAGVDPGPVTFGRWFDVMPYSDEVYLMTATGAQIAAMLQSNAQRVLRPEEIGTTDTAGFIARGFLHASRGLTWRIELGASHAGARASDIRLFGRPVEEAAEKAFTIATTTYLALGSFGERWNGAPLSGGVPGDLPGFDLRAWPRENTGLVYRQVLAERIRATGRIEASLDGRLRVSAGPEEA